MSYATQTDLEKWIDGDRFIRLTDDHDTGVVNSGIVEAILESASLEIDGYLGGRYSLPISPAPAILKKLCVDIGGYLLHIRREESPGDFWETRYNNATAFLTKIASGEINLGVGDPDGTGSGNTVELDGPGRVFSRDSLKEY